ncbi:hypothetical protein ACQEVC_25790 [Plantactinospora sp. CA-294935]|uniref:hypothetical protein n=1 Tax=Plantactinospora sp. CA-294935 TaxID=3240012 RepID=UPI003D9477A3
MNVETSENRRDHVRKADLQSVDEIVVARHELDLAANHHYATQLVEQPLKPRDVEHLQSDDGAIERGILERQDVRCPASRPEAGRWRKPS